MVSAIPHYEAASQIRKAGMRLCDACHSGAKLWKNVESRHVVCYLCLAGATYDVCAEGVRNKYNS